MKEITLTPGDITIRPKVQEMFGGGQGQGIQPCKETPNVLLYSDPEKGHQSGYYDGWLKEADEDGPIYEYTGHGEKDQTFIGRDGVGNKAILYHAADGRDLRLFVADGLARDYTHLRVPPTSTMKAQRYIGEFKLDTQRPYDIRVQPNKKGDLRKVIVFRLRPTSGLVKEHKDEIPPASETEVLTVPSDVTTSALIEPEASKKAITSKVRTAHYTAKRREAELSAEFQEFLERKGHSVKRFQIRIKGTTTTLLTDLYDVSEHVLYEVKASASRENIRMAIGQLLDYRRHVTPENPIIAILLPTEPHDDLKELLAYANVSVVYKNGNSFSGWPLK